VKSLIDGCVVVLFAIYPVPRKLFSFLVKLHTLYCEIRLQSVTLKWWFFLWKIIVSFCEHFDFCNLPTRSQVALPNFELCLLSARRKSWSWVISNPKHTILVTDNNHIRDIFFCAFAQVIIIDCITDQLFGFAQICTQHIKRVISLGLCNLRAILLQEINQNTLSCFRSTPRLECVWYGHWSTRFYHLSLSFSSDDYSFSSWYHRQFKLKTYFWYSVTLSFFQYEKYSYVFLTKYSYVVWSFLLLLLLSR